MHYGTVVVVGEGKQAAAKVLSVARNYKNYKNKVVAIVNSYSSDYLMMERKLRHVCDELIIAAENNTKLAKGAAIEQLKGLISQAKNIDLIHTVGSKSLLKNIEDFTRPFQIRIAEPVIAKFEK